MPPRIVWYYDVTHQAIVAHRGHPMDLLKKTPPERVYARSRGGQFYRGEAPWTTLGVEVRGGTHTDPLAQVERVTLVTSNVKALKSGSREQRQAATLFVRPEGTALPAAVGSLYSREPTQAERCAGGLHADWGLARDGNMRCTSCGVHVKEAFRRVPYPRPPSRAREVQKGLDALQTIMESIKRDSPK